VFHALKRDLMAGRYGKVISAGILTLWPRDKAYYARSPWAGQRYIGTESEPVWVFDSILSNANAHAVNLMLFLMGGTMGRSVQPVDVTAELYRAHDIGSFDTCVVRSRLDNGAELFYAGSHATQTTAHQYTIQCENAVITFGQNDASCIATTPDGAVVRYGDLYGKTPDDQKLWDTVAAVRNECDVYSTLEAARSHVLLVNGADRSSEITTIPFEGIDDALTRCWTGYRDQSKMFPSQLGVSWAKPGALVALGKK
jgi:predicted dehydrogenase